MYKKEFQELLIKYKNGTSTVHEVEEMTRLLDINPEFYALIDADVDQDWKNFSAGLKDGKDQIPKSISKKQIVSRTSMWKVAAAIALLIAAGTVWWFTSNSGQVHYHTDFGERQMIELPDGSQVTLNANSELTWSTNWKRTGIRSVTLDGEAFFEVAKYKAQKFEVNTGDVVVKVLGTSFNVSNRRGDTKVYLEEGKVQLALPGVEELAMVPGDKIEYESISQKIEKTEMETLRSAAAWKTGVISFQEQPLNRIIPELSDIYGVELICVDSALNDKVMDVGVPYMDWEATKQSLELAMKVAIQEIDGKYYIESK
ncbi:FecR domain-containing protein [Membranicola marinus]|uniref:FecR domain-containing protein n=1 Tax=Membranihabitans marinus TaxID=1227546 RepID=A0A953HVV3_9BACT|nr:FecR domain-containing protein [Membranihabitans marinus]MBY5958773.1 FecR domain-containing protein [Membranihabitans marinus]